MSAEVTKLRADGEYGLRLVLPSGRICAIDQLASLSPRDRKSAKLARVSAEKRLRTMGNYSQQNER